MKLSKAGRNMAVLFLLLASAMPVAAREDRAARGVEAGGLSRMWAAVAEWVAKLGPGIDPNGVAAPVPVEEGGEDRADVGPEIDPNGRM